VTGSSDKTIRQWDVNTGQCILTMDILWAISNPPAATIDTVHTPMSPRRPGILARSSTHYRSSSYDDHELLASPGASLVGLPGAGLLSAATGQSFAVPTPPYADGSWEMYQDFVGGVQFWGYALASGSGDGGVRMWDSESLRTIHLGWSDGLRSANGTSTSNAHWSYGACDMPTIRRELYHQWRSRQDHQGE
jgi:division protein 1